jgi:hypothetical protein
MNFKKGYIEVCLTTEDSIQHLRCHGWLKREKYLIKSEHIFNKAEKKDFGMFIIVITNDDLYGIIELKEDMFNSFEVLSKEEERWNTYKKIKERDYVENISNFMFSLAPENKIDIDMFIEQVNEATLKMLKSFKDFKGDYVTGDFLTPEEKIKDLDILIEFFEKKERYEDCAFLLKIKDKVVSGIKAKEK